MSNFSTTKLYNKFFSDSVGPSDLGFLEAIASAEYRTIFAFPITSVNQMHTLSHNLQNYQYRSKSRIQPLTNDLIVTQLFTDVPTLESLDLTQLPWASVLILSSTNNTNTNYQSSIVANTTSNFYSVSVQAYIEQSNSEPYSSLPLVILINNENLNPNNVNPTPPDLESSAPFFLVLLLV